MTASPRPPRKRKNVVPATPLKLWQDSPRQEEVRIEIIPLIDVIFCILTFFILAAVGVSRQQAINLNLPKANSGSAQMQEMLVVSLDSFGQVYVSGNPIATPQLSQAAESYFISRPNGLMALYASKDTRYDQVIEVLDILRAAGGDRVALATTPKGSTPPGQQPTLDPNNPLNPPLPSSLTPLPGADIPSSIRTSPGLTPIAPQDRSSSTTPKPATSGIPSTSSSGSLDVAPTQKPDLPAPPTGRDE